MARKLDKIVVVDIEATCWNGTTPEGMENDIIEVGVCLEVTKLIQHPKGHVNFDPKGLFYRYSGLNQGAQKINGKYVKQVRIGKN